MKRTLFLTAWLILVVILKIPSKISFLLGVLFLTLSSVFMALDHQGFALRLATYSFGVFFIGLVSYLLELKNAKK